MGETRGRAFLVGQGCDSDARPPSFAGSVGAHPFAGNMRAVAERQAVSGTSATQTSMAEGFYDHQLRADDDVLAVFRYIYLNPYRAGLLPESETWPGYRCRAEDWNWFGPLTRESAPQPEWLR